jgi:hypothetical protein
MKLVLGTLLLFVVPAVTHADTIHSISMPEIVTVSKEITAGSDLPLRGDMSRDLAENLLIAQADPSCSYCGIDSLNASIQSVDRAIWLESLTPSNGPYCNDNNCSLVWTVSTIAVDPNLTLSFTPSSLNFGEVVVGTTWTGSPGSSVPTPEPSTLTLAFLGLIVSLAALIYHKQEGLP